VYPLLTAMPTRVSCHTASVTTKFTDLSGYVDLVGYELTELVNLSVWIVRDWPFDTNANQTFRNALLEAELVHARCLLEFLLNKDNKGQSIVGSRLSPHWTPPNEEKLDQEYKRICDHLAHLSKKRLPPQPAPKWNISALVGMILDALESLAGQLGPATHEQTLRSLVSQAREVQAAQLFSVTNLHATTNSTSMVTILGSTGLPNSRSYPERHIE
jgi:hypothetical protein